MRTFLAIDISDEARGIVAQLQTRLSRLPGVRLTRPEQCHLTLKFLGELDEQTCACITALDEIRQPSFELSLTNLDAFPDAKRPRVIWLGVSKPPAMMALAHVVHAATGTIALDKPFAAHVTVARVNAAKVRFDAHLLALEVQPCTFEVSEFVLYRSVLGPAGSRYEVIRKFALIA